MEDFLFKLLLIIIIFISEKTLLYVLYIMYVLEVYFVLCIVHLFQVAIVKCACNVKYIYLGRVKIKKIWVNVSIRDTLKITYY